MFDDRVPEEDEQAYTHLLTALRSSAQQHAPITANEQTEILARVRERLAGAAATSAAPTGGKVAPHRQFLPGIPTLHPRISTRWTVRLLTALGVLVLLVGTSWALFKAAAPTWHTLVGPPSATHPVPAAQTQFDGLDASMQVFMDGPYFLSELLPVEVELTNHRQESVTLPGTGTTATLCHDSALTVKVTGSDPGFVFPKLDIGCDQVAYMTVVQPGETLNIHQYVPLTRSGAVTLAMQSAAYAGSDLLDGHWPSVHIQVDSQVPQNRALALSTLQSLPPQVVVQTPEGLHPQLLYMESISCKDYSGGGPDQWTPLTTTILHQPPCPAINTVWQYVVSAVGYAIASGVQSE